MKEFTEYVTEYRFYETLGCQSKCNATKYWAMLVTMCLLQIGKYVLQ